MKTLAIIKYLFTAIGIGLLIGALLIYQNTQNFLGTALTTKGIVTDLIRSRSSDSYTYKPLVEFETEEGLKVEFVSSTGSNPPSYSVGEVVDVLYQPSSPEKAKISGFFSLWGLSVIMGGIGTVFFLIGFSIILSARLKRKKISYLKSHGIPITTALQSVGINRSLKVNGRSPYQIITQWQNPQTLKLHVFTSENIWFDPSDYIKTDEITVLIERNNPRKYHVDISFLPELAD